MAFQQLTGVIPRCTIKLTSDRCNSLLCPSHLLASRLSLPPRKFSSLRHLRNNKLPLHNPSPTLRRQNRSTKALNSRKPNHLNSPSNTRLPLRQIRYTSPQWNPRSRFRSTKIHSNNLHLHRRRNICVNLGNRRKTLHSRNHTEPIQGSSMCYSTMDELDYEFRGCVDCAVFFE